jgi:hypothetical protein
MVSTVQKSGAMSIIVVGFPKAEFHLSTHS